MSTELGVARFRRLLYGSMAILVASTVTHFYTTAHIAITASLRQIDGEIEAVARSLQRPWWPGVAKPQLD